MTKKLHFENTIIIFPTENDMEEDWIRLQEYMAVYFANHRKNKRIDEEYERIGEQRE